MKKTVVKTIVSLCDFEREMKLTVRIFHVSISL